MKTRRLAGRLEVIAVCILSVLAVSGCGLLMGSDGEDGVAYIAYSWAVGPIVFSTNDPAFAGVPYISNGQYRQTIEGTYTFEYIAWDDSYWYGAYTIYIDEGTPGSFLLDGLDGEDLFFELACYSFGPSLYVWTEEFAYLSHSDRFSIRRALDRSREKAIAGPQHTEDTQPALAMAEVTDIRDVGVTSNASDLAHYEFTCETVGRGWRAILSYARR